MSIESKKSEFDHFSRLASDWWSKNGKFKILHDIQSIRIKYIQEALNKNKLKTPKYFILYRNVKKNIINQIRKKKLNFL